MALSKGFYKMGDDFWACVKKCLNLKAESHFSMNTVFLLSDLEW